MRPTGGTGPERAFRAEEDSLPRRVRLLVLGTKKVRGRISARGCWGFRSSVSIFRVDADERVRRARLTAQRLTPATACASAEEAARAVIGVQAQDLRAARLALRSRVPGLTRGAVRAAALLRTWTVRGTVHLIAASDRSWLHALLADRNARVFGARFERFGIVEEVNAMRGDVVELCGERPRDRVSLLRALVERGHRSLEQRAINTFVPWLSTQGLIVTDIDGLLHAADPPPAVDHDEALAILGARYRAGYGPCDAADLAKWSSLPITQARRALDAARPPREADAWPADDPPPCLLLAAFDTLMLGYRTREPFVAAEHDHHVLKGGGMLKPVVLSDGIATGTWSINKRRPEPSWFDRPAPSAALASETADIERFLAS
jgi:winged helix DNA-binding protein